MTSQASQTKVLWTIENMSSGLVLGAYPGATAAEALDAMAREAGYADHAHAIVETGPADLRVTEVAYEVRS